MGLLVPVESDLWRRIYYGLRDDAMERYPNDTMATGGAGLEARFALMGITMHRGDPDRVWTHAEFADGIDAVELVLRWG